MWLRNSDEYIFRQMRPPLFSVDTVQYHCSLEIGTLSFVIGRFVFRSRSVRVPLFSVSSFFFVLRPLRFPLFSVSTVSFVWDYYVLLCYQVRFPVFVLFFWRCIRNVIKCWSVCHFIIILLRWIYLFTFLFGSFLWHFIYKLCASLVSCYNDIYIHKHFEHNLCTSVNASL